MRYDYLENVREDVLEYIKENYEKEDYANLNYEDLYEEMWTADSVTGNGSGSYTFNTWEAEENICHNLDLAAEAYENFGYEGVKFEDGAEAIDVTIRCYLLGQVLNEVLDDLRGE
jgi:hypothetical protein